MHPKKYKKKHKNMPYRTLTTIHSYNYSGTNTHILTYTPRTHMG